LRSDRAQFFWSEVGLVTPREVNAPLRSFAVVQDAREPNSAKAGFHVREDSVGAPSPVLVERHHDVWLHLVRLQEVEDGLVVLRPVECVQAAPGLALSREEGVKALALST